MRKLSLGAVAAAVIAAIGAQSPAYAADNDIVIGFAVALSGWMNAYDGPPLKGAEMAIADFNAKGGVLGRKLRAVISDTKSDQTEGAKAGQSVIADGANFMVVSCDYDMGAGAATVANDHKMIAISFCASDAKMGAQGIGPYAFTMSNSSLTSGAALAEWAWTKKGWRNAYLLLDPTIEYDKTICGGFKTRWQKLGGKLQGEDTFKQDDASIASQITRVQQADSKGKIDLMMVCSYDGGAVSAIRQIRAAGIQTPLGGGDSMDGDYWAKGIPNLNDHYTGTYGSAFGDDPRPRYNEFMERVAKYNDGQRLPTSFAVTGYSVIEAYVLAIQRAGSIDNDKVLAEMNKFNKEDFVVGPTTFTPDLHINLMRPQAIMGIRDGKGYSVDLVQLPEPPPLQLIFKNK
jgi:branched-chain amino acid transport system substrate-binding protein